MPPQLALIRPNANLRDSYCALIAEFVVNGDALVPFTLSFDHTDFDKFLTKLDDCYRGVGIPNDFVPHSTFWLVRGGTEVVGVSNFATPLRLRCCAKGATSAMASGPPIAARAWVLPSCAMAVSWNLKSTWPTGARLFNAIGLRLHQSIALFESPALNRS